VRYLAFLVAVLSCGFFVWAQETAELQKDLPPPGYQNLALGMPYTLEPAPHYEHCTDPDDVKQLTDGAYSQGYFWTQPSTVGWSGTKPIITFDLGKDSPIRGVSYSTAAGVAGVEWPVAIFLFVAGDDRQFRFAGDLVDLSVKHGQPPAQGYGLYRFWTDALETHGRYLAMVVDGSPFVFVDEIEVYAGAPDWLSVPVPGEATGDLKSPLGAMAVHSCTKRRIHEDVEGVRQAVADSTVPEVVRKAINQELERIVAQQSETKPSSDKDFRAVLPLNDFHARVFRAQAQLWRAKGLGPFVLWQTGLWDALSPHTEPPKESRPAVTVKMMQNEFRAASFNISNTTDAPVTFELRVAGLPGGINPPCVTVHKVLWTDTHAGTPVAAALPEAERNGEAYSIDVLPGLTQQVWFTFHPVDVAAGSYEGSVELKSPGVTLSVPVLLTVYPFRFPDKPTLHLGGWDYTNMASSRDVTEQNRGLLVRHLQEHFVDAPWATSAAMPSGEYDDAGNMTKMPDTVNFDQWLELWPQARQYCVFLAVGSSFDKWPMEAPEFETGVKAYASFWAQHAKDKGLKPEQILLLLVDEPSDPKQDAVILAWAKAIKASGSGLRIWEDPIYQDMSKANQEMVAACDVLCPNRCIFLAANPTYREYFVAQRERGATLEFYSCSGPMRLLDPYHYVRLQAWECWRYGAVGSYFWAFSDGGGASSWNEYALQGNSYTPVFLDATSVTAGKHMEACRESVEDYEYLVMLKKAVDEAAGRGVSGEVVQRAQSLLNEGPACVCDAKQPASYRWHRDEVDRSLADQVRVEILETLTALTAGK